MLVDLFCGILELLNVASDACSFAGSQGGKSGLHAGLDKDRLPEVASVHSFASGRVSSLHEHALAFFRYARFFRTSNKNHNTHLRLKRRHTLRVFRNARLIARSEAAFVDPDLARSLALSALYHDIARFSQYTRYQTFSDAQSFDHGKMGRDELDRLGLLQGETEAVRDRVYAAVALHNRFALPEGLPPTGIPEETRLVAQALRDADKLDILRIMADNLGPGIRPDPVVVMDVEDSPEHSQEVLEAVSHRRLASFADMRTTADFRLLLCGWFYDLNFAASRREAVQGGNLLAVARGLPDTEALAAFKDRYIRDLRY